jgi:hypothetical protein
MGKAHNFFQTTPSHWRRAFSLASIIQFLLHEICTPYNKFAISRTSPDKGISCILVQLGGIESIIWTYSGEKIEISNWLFHHFVFSSNNSLTVASGSNSNRGELTRKLVGLGSHLSFQIRIFVPFPTFHISLSLRSQELKILRQTKQGLQPILASKIELSG